MKKSLVAAALILAALGSGQLASGQHPAAAHTGVQAASVTPNDLGWGGSPTTPIAR